MGYCNRLLVISTRSFILTYRNVLFQAFQELIDSDVKTYFDGEAEANIISTHRQKNGVHFYILNNRDMKEYSMTLSVKEKMIPEIWIPESGKSLPLHVYRFEPNFA